MKPKETDISPGELRRVLRYEPETGAVYRTVRLAQRHQVGDRADTEIRSGRLAGYRLIGAFGGQFLAHRVIWALVHGKWPSGVIDHINGRRSDNRLVNLRDVSQQVNVQNVKGPTSRNKSGYLGVFLHAPGVWRACIGANKKYIHLGCFRSPEAAHRAYLTAKRKYHEGCLI